MLRASFVDMHNERTHLLTIPYPSPPHSTLLLMSLQLSLQRARTAVGVNTKLLENDLQNSANVSPSSTTLATMIKHFRPGVPFPLSTLPTYGGRHWVDYTDNKAYHELQSDPRQVMLRKQGRHEIVERKCDDGLEMDLLGMAVHNKGYTRKRPLQRR